MFKRSFRKPDGRNLTLYGHKPISEEIIPTNPEHSGQIGQPHLRWHPMLEEWVAFASHRQDRTFLPPKEYNPLAVTREFPTELPQGEYQVAVFDNLFASLSVSSHVQPELYVPTRPANGHCEVVVFTQDPERNLGRMAVDEICLVLEVLSDRYIEIAKQQQIEYILPFENRGVEMGATLHHPHGQIYAYPFIPRIQQQMLRSQKSFFQNNKRTLLSEILEKEKTDGRRVVFEGEKSLAFVPAFARYPYEVWIAPLRPVSSLNEFRPEEFRDLARTLKVVLQKYETLWNRPFPYLMLFLGAPTDGEEHPEWHFHIEFHPPLRSKDKLKYLAGTELGAGMFVNDSLPEAKAEELRQIEVRLGRD